MAIEPLNPVSAHINEPELLERTYRDSPSEFEKHLERAILEQPNSETLRVWQARLKYNHTAPTNKIPLLEFLLICCTTALLSKLPSIIPIDESWYYPRFIPFIILSALILYFVRTNKPDKKIIKTITLGLLLVLAYLFVIPNQPNSDTATMALLHIPIFCLALLAISFMAKDWKTPLSRIPFILYLGEITVLVSIILLGGMVLTGITIGLFDLIGVRIGEWYTKNIVVYGLVTSPIVATYLFDITLRRQSRIASILSNIFAPLFLITVIAYLSTMAKQGKTPFTDRDFLIIFNWLILAILAISLFSIFDKLKEQSTKLVTTINTFLIAATIILDGIALSAIIYRWVEHGMTLNRFVITGLNFIVFCNLLLLARRYLDILKGYQYHQKLKESAARFLPIYTLWSFIVAFILPLHGLLN